jgi:transposase
MLTVPATTRVYLASEPVDMRKGFDGLCAIVAERWKQDPFSGYLFVFVGKKRDRIKVLFWDQGGFALYYKRLEKGRFQMPDTSSGNVRLEPTELAMLLSGIDLNRSRLRRWQPPETAIDKSLSP